MQCINLSQDDIQKNFCKDVTNTCVCVCAHCVQSICHDWSDERCMKLLSNCYKALPEDGKVIVVEHILPECLDTSLNAMVVVYCDLTMLAHCPGGKERTKRDFEALASATGFAGIRFANCAYNVWIMEFYKRI